MLAGWDSSQKFRVRVTAEPMLCMNKKWWLNKSEAQGKKQKQNNCSCHLSYWDPDVKTLKRDLPLCGLACNIDPAAQEHNCRS